MDLNQLCEVFGPVLLDLQRHIVYCHETVYHLRVPQKKVNVNPWPGDEWKWTMCAYTT